MSKIIDLSQHNGANIDFTKIKANGYEGVICRAGYRGYGSTGSLVKDTLFDTYYTKAKAQGLLFGAYWFSQGLSYTEGMEEGLQLVECCKGKTIDYPLVIDVENSTSSNGTGRADGNTVTQWEQVIKGFHNVVTSNNYKSMIYCNPDYLNNRIGTRPSGMYLWLAHWVSNTTYKCDVWQYTSKGDGTNYGQSNANNALDLNTRYTDFGQGTTTNTGNTTTSPSQPTQPIAIVQTWFNTFSYNNITVDNISGANTKKANVKIIQSCIGTTVDGIYGTNSSNKWDSKVLSASDNGNLVKGVQARLICLGLPLTYGLDGKYGVDTENAIKLAQKMYGLTQDGKCGKNTMLRLFG